MLLQLNFEPFPILESERLIYRKLTEDDADAIYRLRSNPDTMQFIPRPLLKTQEEAIEMIQWINQKIAENTDINWGICKKDTGEMISFSGFYRMEPENHRTEIGYMLLPEHAGKGYVTEIVATLLKYGFETLSLNSICAVIDPDNIASEKVLQKNNFKKEGHFKQDILFDGRFLDSVYYAILKSEY